MLEWVVPIDRVRHCIVDPAMIDGPDNSAAECRGALRTSSCYATSSDRAATSRFSKRIVYQKTPRTTFRAVCRPVDTLIFPELKKTFSVARTRIPFRKIGAGEKLTESAIRHDVWGRGNDPAGPAGVIADITQSLLLQLFAPYSSGR